MQTVVLDNSQAPAPYHGLPPLEREFEDGDARLIVLPPGDVDIRIMMKRPMIDVNLNHVANEIAVNTDRRRSTHVRSESVGFFPTGTEVSLKVTNVLPGCLVEVEDRALAEWLGVSDTDSVAEYADYQADPVAAEMGRAGIRFLSSDNGATLQDRLTLESLALGIAARAVARLVAKNGNVEEEQQSWRGIGDAARIHRAIDYAETHLTDPALSVARLAAVAELSSCHFCTVFKTHTGETPYAYILRRRAQFARDLLIGTREPIAAVAYAAGFSSQAHLTTVMRRHFGVTPGKLRTLS